METIRNEHLSEAEIEDCARNRLRREDAEAVLGHFLNCDHCAALVDEERQLRQDFIEAAEFDARNPQIRPKLSWANTRVFPIPALAALVVGAVVLLSPQFQGASDKMQTVELTAYRGPANTTVASANAPLVLKMDATGLEYRSGLELRIVDEAGRQVWQSTPQMEALQWVATMKRRLPGGVYWARLIRPGEETPAREFRLNIK